MKYKSKKKNSKRSHGKNNRSSMGPLLARNWMSMRRYLKMKENYHPVADWLKRIVDYNVRRSM